ncbi:hypothetical protein VNO77_38896 [Canavalia gladiata]|uniref:Uncharacterized protein n=1 Tax=Canavalia gladiata TaxID=3824 RepID=A0AAN9KCL7_CANGL
MTMNQVHYARDITGPTIAQDSDAACSVLQVQTKRSFISEHLSPDLVHTAISKLSYGITSFSRRLVQILTQQSQPPHHSTLSQPLTGIDVTTPIKSVIMYRSTNELPESFWRRGSEDDAPQSSCEIAIRERLFNFEFSWMFESMDAFSRPLTRTSFRTFPGSLEVEEGSLTWREIQERSRVFSSKIFRKQTKDPPLCIRLLPFIPLFSFCFSFSFSRLQFSSF